LLSLVCIAAPAQCQDGAEWDRARAAMLATQPGNMVSAIARWRQLTQSPALGFDDYAGFLLAYPGFPDERKLRLAAEKSLDSHPVSPDRLVAFFDRFPPLTNPARAQYALALMQYARPEAGEVARAAWRGGTMSDAAEGALLGAWGTRFTPADYDARMNALVWDGNAAQAARAAPAVSPEMRAQANSELAVLQGADPATIPADARALADPTWLYASARKLYQSGRARAAADLLGGRGALSVPPLDPTKWIHLQLAIARDVGGDAAVRIAEHLDDAFPAGTDVSKQSFAIRDDYTSLAWLAGTTALWSLSDPRRAAPLFYHYGQAAKTPPTRAKGFYWAGRALARSGQGEAGARYFAAAAAYPDQYYGMLALERLGKPLPDLAEQTHPQPSEAARGAFYARPLTLAVEDAARDADWPTTIRFFREISDQAATETDQALVAELARRMGRRDLGVVLGQAAANDGSYGGSNFRYESFPLIPTPPSTDWTIVHAISRQESQFSTGAISRTGARGLMQLMPGTAAAEARKEGLPYSTTALTSDPQLNMKLGDGVFAHLMDSYGGSYPLAIAAYNAGPGNVNKWLRDIGDPRSGSIDWVDWVERLPFSETRGYVAHVIENAVVYEAMNPVHATYKGPNPVSHFLGKRTPG
jgi:soluble lytic murein transglycosylase